MANQWNPIGGRKRLGRWTVAALLLAGAGCGFEQHGPYGGDPLFGNFNRPIAPTPPIWTGGDPGLSPAYDGGARVGLPSPDVPARSNTILDRMFIVPTYTGSIGLGAVINGTPAPARAPGSGPASSVPAAGPSGSNSSINLRPATPITSGAQLMQMPQPTIDGNRFLPGVVAAPNSVTPRMMDANTILTSGAMIEPMVMIPKPVSTTSGMKDPRTVISVEEGESILQVCGAKAMVMEPQPTGEWRFVCTVGNGGEARNYEARAVDQIEAVRAVMWQVKNEP